MFASPPTAGTPRHDRKGRLLGSALGLGALLAFAAPEVLPAQQVHQSQHHNFRVVTVADGLVNPWSIAFLPGGDMLVTERPGRLRIIRDGRLLPDPVPGLPSVRTGGQGGLLDVVPHPDFASNRLLYISYAKPNADDSEGTTAVIRGRFENDRLTDVEEIFEADAWVAGRGHHGSRIAFDGNGYVFISVGDRQAAPRGDLEAHPAQDVGNHIGTILRLHDDGRVPSDNPFVGQAGAKPEIWSYGHRNPQGLAFDPRSGLLWSNEHGPQGGDELNLIQPGLNYGWPVIGYGVNYGAAMEPIHRETHREGMEQPVHHWTPSIATSGLVIYTGDRFPHWQGSIFTGGMSGQHQVLSRVTVDERLNPTEELLLDGDLRIRDVRQGPDGFIYLAVDHRSGDPTPIVRLEPVN
jgi:aldose sugar dehydrogenase